MKPFHLACTSCGRAWDADRTHPRCDDCGEPLEVRLEIRSGAGPQPGDSLFARWRDFLPFDEGDPVLSLGEGNTPLLRSRQAADQFGLSHHYLKNESVNPTWSFKDRGTATALAWARAMGYERIGTVSTGNMAVSVAAYGAAAGLDTTVLVSSTIAVEKVPPIAVHRPHIVLVDGDYGDLYFRSLEAGARFGIAFLNSDVPFRVEGSKTIALELWEQLGGNAPDVMIVPVSAGGNLRGIVKGFEELHAAGLSERIPMMIAAQARGCSPVVTAFESGEATVKRVERPDTMAHAIDNPFPPSGNEVLRMLSRLGGLAVAVEEEEIVSAQALLAADGLFGQPAAAVPLAALRRLRDQGRVGEEDTVVCTITGAGLKYTAALEHHPFEPLSCRLEDLEATLG